MDMLVNAGTDEASEDFTFVASDAVVIVEGTFDGESVYIERKRDDGTYSALADGELSDANEKLVRLWRGAIIRLKTSNGAGSPIINGYIMQRDN